MAITNTNIRVKCSHCEKDILVDITLVDTDMPIRCCYCDRTVTVWANTKRMIPFYEGYHSMKSNQNTRTLCLQ
jgi:DNA-directed RNA polymerase subunit RPC12/RpoP